MKRQIVALIACALTAFALLPSAGAHHSISARFDLSRNVSVEGIVTQFAFRNPHSLVYVDKDADPAQPWVLQWHSTQILRRHGYGPETLKMGDRIVVTGNPARDGSRMLRILTLSRPADGFSYEADQAEEFLLGL
jgi:hypothetical protein